MSDHETTPQLINIRRCKRGFLVDPQPGQAWLTQRTYDLMKDLVANQFTVPAP